MAKYQRRRRKTIHKNYHNGAAAHQKRGEQVSPFPSKSAEIVVKILLEIPLQQALECLAVTGLVPGHLVNGVMDSVQAQLLGLLGNGHLAGSGAVLSVYTHLKILLGGVGDNLAQQLGELSGVLCLFIGGLSQYRPISG